MAAASSSSESSCFQCEDSISESFKNGWRLRSGDFARLCNRCGLIISLFASLHYNHFLTMYCLYVSTYICNLLYIYCLFCVICCVWIRVIVCVVFYFSECEFSLLCISMSIICSDYSRCRNFGRDANWSCLFFPCFSSNLVKGRISWFYPVCLLVWLEHDLEMGSLGLYQFIEQIFCWS